MLDYPLYDLKAILRTKYPSLIFVEGSDSSFIQVFKPCSRSGKTCGLDFLPSFSVIVTINDSSAKFSLMTYHGKVLCVETMDLPFKHENLRLLEMIQSDELDVCQGFKQFAQVEDLTLTAISTWSQDWKSTLLFETFGTLITMRSGQCSYICKNKYQLCPECHLLLQTNDGNGSIDINNLEMPMKCEVKIEEELENGTEKIKVEEAFDSKMEMLKNLESISVTLGETNDSESSSKNSTLLMLHTSFGELVDVEDSDVVNDEYDGVSVEEVANSHKSPAVSQTSRARAKKSSPKKATKKSPYKSQKPKASKDDNQSYQCEVCLLVFVERYRYLRCMSRHEEVFNLEQSTICPVCQKTIETKLKVTEHFKDVHSDMGETCCCECLKLIHKEDGELRKHILKEHHSARKAYLCDDCGKEYKSSDNLQAHIRQIHQKITSFVCSYCGDTFARLNTLKSHMLSHKPPTLKCLYCEKMFRKKDLLIKHLQLHTKFKPLKCKNCNYFSDRRGNIRLHFEKSHGKKWTEDDMVVNMVEYRQMRKIVLQQAASIVKEAKDREKQ